MFLDHIICIDMMHHKSKSEGRKPGGRDANCLRNRKHKHDRWINITKYLGLVPSKDMQTPSSQFCSHFHVHSAENVPKIY